MCKDTTYGVRVEECLLHVRAVGVGHLALVHAHVLEGQVVDDEVPVGQHLVLAVGRVLDGLVGGALPHGLVVALGAADQVGVRAYQLQVGAHPLVDDGGGQGEVHQVARGAAIRLKAYLKKKMTCQSKLPKHQNTMHN